MANTMSGSYYSGGKNFYVDMSDVQRQIDFLRGILNEKTFEALIYRTFKETANKSRTLISNEVVKDYAVPKYYVRSAIGRYSIKFGGDAPVTCMIPLHATKGIIGGRFRLRSTRAQARAAGRIRTDILRRRTSTLPAHLPGRLGGNAPFIGGGSIDGLVFARRGRARLPIIRVVGVASPQMPLNQSEEKVQDALLEYTGQRLEHNFYFMLGKGK